MTIGRDVAELLVASTREHDWSVPEPLVVELARRLPPERIVAAAQHHRVVGCVVTSLRGADVPTPLSDALGAVARRLSGHALLAAAAMQTVRASFADDLPWLAVKGPVLDGAVYPRPRLRGYRDLDVVVPPDRVEEAVGRLERERFHLADRNWRQILDRMIGQLHVEREGSAPIDLHWTLIYDEPMRRTFRYPMADMFARARSVDVAGGPVRTLDAEDTLIHVAVHAAMEGADRLVWLKDVDAVARAGLDWDTLVARATEYGTRLPLAIVLARSRRALDAPVPSDVVARLAPRSWRATLAGLEAVFPVARSRGLGTPATLLARSARASTIDSVATAATGFVRRSRSAIAHGRLTKLDRRFDPEHEGSLLHPAGGRADRDAYFARLAMM